MRRLAQRRIVVRDYGCNGSGYHTAAFARPRCQGRRRVDAPLARRGFHATASQGIKDPYQTLGVYKQAAASEIKKAYYSLAKKYHPDTNKDPKAKDRFAEIQSAYEILSDPQKRKQYDQFGAAAFDPSAGGGGAGDSGGNPFAGGFAGFGGKGGFPFEDIFAAFTGGGGGAGGRRRRGGSSPFEAAFTSAFEQGDMLVGENIETFCNITFAEAAKGTTKTVTITPMTTCTTCSGHGLKSGSKKEACKNCNGTGTRLHFLHGGIQMAAECNSCEGIGSTIPKGSECSTCSGNGITRQRFSMPVNIPAGIEDGMRLKFEGEGDAPPLGRHANPNAAPHRGDLYVSIRVARDAKFVRDGPNLLHVTTIPFTTALLGGQISVPTLDGYVSIKVATGTNTGDRQVLAGMGMKRLNKKSAWGDLQIEFKVNMPKSLNSKQRTLLEFLADEMGDKSARRLVNVNRPMSTPADDADDHKREGWLKSIWHALTSSPAHETNNNHEPADGKKNAKDEPNKSSGSGSG